jgi:Uma2 family endonuclease
MSVTNAVPAIDELLKNTDRALLHNVPWDVYMAMRDDDANRHVRMAYYQGTLELMSPRYRHEKYTSRLAQFVLRFAEVMDIACTESRSTTFRREDEGAGKEADTSFYIAHEPLIRDKDEIDLSVDPPPDLAIEVDDANESRSKLPIYAALKIPEVWRYDARTGVLWFGSLRANGTYITLKRSKCLPLLTPDRVLEALSLCQGRPQSGWGRVLQEWVRGLTP